MSKHSQFTIIFLLVAFTAFSQGNEFVFSWQIASPGNGIKTIEDRTFIDKTSFQGWNFEYRRALSNTISVGGSVAWNIFHEDIDKSTWIFDNVAITSRNWRFTHVVPISVNAHFNPLRNNGSPIQLFMGAGLGTSYVNQEIWAGTYEFRHETWAFHAYPELGLRYVMSDQTALCFSTQYMVVTNASYAGETINYWNFKLGFSFGRHKW